jgi:signal transduction histidine kinase
MNDGSEDPVALRSRQTIVGCIVAIVAGACTRWLSDAPVLVLSLVAVSAVVLVFATPAVQVRVILAGSVLAATLVRLPELQVEEMFEGLVSGLLTALVLAAPLTTRRAVSQRREFHQRGWELAAIESRRRASQTREVLQRERMTLAAEMHDGLGHSLTLIAVRLGQLSLAPTLSDADRTQVSDIRTLAADAADQLGLAVRLLRQSEDPAAGWTPPNIDEAVVRARHAGIDVDAHIAADLADRLGDEALNAVARVVQEGLTNASKHSPGQPVTVRVEIEDETVTAVVRNPRGEGESSAHTPDSGFGLHGLRHRAAILGGTLTVRHTSTEFSLILTLPTHARPSADSAAPDEGIVAAEDAAATLRSRATRAAIAVPTTILGALVFIAGGYFVLANTLSVMTTAQFADISVGDTQETVERSLPALEMLDPPRDDFPPRPDEACHYFEEEISFFERVDVHVVCFATGQVSRIGTVPAP